MTLTKKQRIHGHKRFLAICGKRIGEFAWDSFQKSGRGMVVAPEEDCLREDFQTVPPRLSYAARESSLMTEISLHFESTEWGWLETYAPEKQVIVIVVRTDIGTSGYLMSVCTKSPQIRK